MKNGKKEGKRERRNLCGRWMSNTHSDKSIGVDGWMVEGWVEPTQKASLLQG